MSHPPAEKKPRPNLLTITKKRLLVLVLLLVVAGGYLLIYSLSKPAQGTIAASLNAGQSATAAATWLTQSGKYISFDYPSNFEPKPADKPSGVQLEAFRYVKGPWPFWNMSVSVSRLPSNNPSDDSSYNLRAVSPDKYKHEKWDINGSLVDVFSYLPGGYEKAAFIARGGKLLTVDINSNDPESSAKLDSIMKHVLGSAAWTN